jgi:hypothetical protein
MVGTSPSGWNKPIKVVLGRVTAGFSAPRRRKEAVSRHCRKTLAAIFARASLKQEGLPLEVSLLVGIDTTLACFRKPYECQVTGHY